jgi:hypothetical protein
LFVLFGDLPCVLFGSHRHAPTNFGNFVIIVKSVFPLLLLFVHDGIDTKGNGLVEQDFSRGGG